MNDPLREQMKDEATESTRFSEDLHQRTMHALQREQITSAARSNSGFWRWPAALAAMLALAAAVWYLRPEAITPMPPQIALVTPPEFPNPDAISVLQGTVRPVETMVSDIRPVMKSLGEDARSLGEYLVRQIPSVPEARQQM